MFVWPDIAVGNRTARRMAHIFNFIKLLFFGQINAMVTKIVQMPQMNGTVRAPVLLRNVSASCFKTQAFVLDRRAATLTLVSLTKKN